MFIDTHAHLYVSEFDIDRSAVVERAVRAGVDKIVLPNIDESTQEKVFSLCDQFPGVCFPSVGLHPCSVKSNYKAVLRNLEKYVQDPRVVAIGESGIDLYWDKTFIKQQEEAFRIQIDWARQLRLPIIIHSRDSIDVTVRIIEEVQDGTLRGVFHCFSESQEIIDRVEQLQFMIGIGGVASFKKMNDFRSLLSNINRQMLILETDAPYLSPEPFRGKRNESAFLPKVGAVVAECLGLTIEQTASLTTANAKSLFNI